MKKHHRTIVVVALSVIVIFGTYFFVLYRMSYSLSGNLEKQESVRIGYTDRTFDLDVDSGVWKEVEPVKVHLFPQSARVAYGNEERDIMVRGIYNDEEIAFLIEFHDESENRGGLENVDACAILFAPGDAPVTAQMMGFESKVNIWQWKADRDTARFMKDDDSVNVIREFVAVGPATQKPLQNQNVDGRGEYDNSRWRVIFKRKLLSQQEDEFDIKPGNDMNIAFAVWDGKKLETFSRKSISILRPLILEEK